MAAMFAKKSSLELVTKIKLQAGAEHRLGAFNLRKDKTESG